MLLYNVTVGVDREIESQWLTWMSSKHIPDMMSTGCFSGCNLYKALSHQEPHSVSYCAQYHLSSIEQFNVYLRLHAPTLSVAHRQLFGEGSASFHTLLEKVDLTEGG